MTDVRAEFLVPEEQHLARIRSEMADHLSVIKSISEQSVIEVGRRLIQILSSPGKVLICGCGGSAADAQHFAAELVGRYRTRGRLALPAIALTTDSSIITSLANDFSFADVFSRQIDAIGRASDVLIAISTSGASPAILKAVDHAKIRRMTTIGITGLAGSPSYPNRLLERCDLAIAVNSAEVARIQEAHGLILHLLCSIIDEEFTP